MKLVSPLDAMLKNMPGSTPLAGVGLFTVVERAIAFHPFQGEANHLGAPVVLSAMAAFVALGRGMDAPISSRP